MANGETLLATLVHISDLHIGDVDPSSGNARPTRLAANVVKNLTYFDGLLGHQARSLQDLARFWSSFQRPQEGEFGLVVTGDYTRCGSGSEFGTATQYLTGQINLATARYPTLTGLSLGSVPRGIPGNHDHWGGTNFPWSGSPTLFGGTNLAPSMPCIWPAVPMANGRSLVVCAVDSDADVSPTGFNRFRAIGSFQSQLASLAPMLGANPGNEVRVLMVHHSWNHQGRILRMTGASKVAMHNFVVAHGIKVVLSGHTHGVKMLPIANGGPPDAHELCCGTTTQLDHVPYDWATLMGTVPNRKWPDNTLLVHTLWDRSGTLIWEAQPWYRNNQSGFCASAHSYTAHL